MGDMAAPQRKRGPSGKTAGQGRKGKRPAAGKGVGAEEAGLPASFDQQPLLAAKCEPRQEIAAGSGALEGESQPPEQLVRRVETTSSPRGGSVSPDITPEEESLMLEALLDYEKRKEEETKDPKNI